MFFYLPGQVVEALSETSRQIIHADFTSHVKLNMDLRAVRYNALTVAVCQDIKETLANLNMGRVLKAFEEALIDIRTEDNGRCLSIHFFAEMLRRQMMNAYIDGWIYEKEENQTIAWALKDLKWSSSGSDVEDLSRVTIYGQRQVLSKNGPRLETKTWTFTQDDMSGACVEDVLHAAGLSLENDDLRDQYDENRQKSKDMVNRLVGQIIDISAPKKRELYRGLMMDMPQKSDIKKVQTNVFGSSNTIFFADLPQSTRVSILSESEDHIHEEDILSLCFDIVDENEEICLPEIAYAKNEAVVGLRA